MSAAEMVPAAKRKKRPFNDTRLPEKASLHLCHSVTYMPFCQAQAQRALLVIWCLRVTLLHAETATNLSRLEPERVYYA